MGLHALKEPLLSYLGYEDLVRAVEDSAVEPHHRLRMSPYDRARVKTASIELHLGSSVARWRHRGRVSTQLAPKRLSDIGNDDFEIERKLGPGDMVVIAPGEALLVAVDCWVAFGSGLIGRVEGKSSVGRAAQIIHTAGFVEPGFVGVLTLEPINMAPFPVAYEVGQPIAQLTIATLERPTLRPYGHPEMGSRYQGQAEVTPPRPTALGTPWDPRLTIPTIPDR